MSESNEDAAAVELVRARMTRDLAINQPLIWEILFSVKYQLRHGILPVNCQGSVAKWWAEEDYKERYGLK